MTFFVFIYGKHFCKNIIFLCMKKEKKKVAIYIEPEREREGEEDEGGGGEKKQILTYGSTNDWF